MDAELHTETRCEMCGKVKGCVPKDKIHAKRRLLDASEIFALIEAEVREKGKADRELEVSKRRKAIRSVK